MTPEQMRELADALEPMAAAPVFDRLDIPGAVAFLRQCAERLPDAWMYEHDGCVDTPIITASRWAKCEEPWTETALYLHPVPRQAVDAAIRHLRAQADAQPVPAGWKPVPVEPTPEMLSAVGMMDGYDWHAPGCSPDADHANWYSAMIAAAPAAPQAEQPIDLDAVAMQQMRQAAAESTWMPAEYSGSDWISDVCRWLRDGPPQAEPKREPVSDERIACLALEHLGTQYSSYVFDLIRAVERAHGITAKE